MLFKQDNALNVLIVVQTNIHILLNNRELEFDRLYPLTVGLTFVINLNLGNKCFRTRDVSFGKGFKDRIGMLPEEKPSEATKWKRVRTVTDLEYNLISAYNEQLAIARFRDAMGLQSGEPT